MNNLELPVKVGDVLYLPKYVQSQEWQKCSVCCGHKSVWVRNIEGEEFEVRCEACGKGFGDLQGFERVYSYEPNVSRFEVKEIKSVDFVRNEIYVCSTMGECTYFASLCATEAEALEKSKEMMAERIKQNMGSRLSAKKQALPEHAWSVQYHNSQIEDAQRRLEWHQSRLLAKRKTKKGA